MTLYKILVNREGSLRQVALVAKFSKLSKPWSCKYCRKKEKIDMYDFPVHDCIQEENGSPYFSSIVRQRE